MSAIMSLRGALRRGNPVRKRDCFAGLAMTILFASSAFALDIPAQPDGYVTDRAGLLSAPVRTKLEQRLADFERETSNQLLVATFPSLEGDSLEDFSIRLAEKWQAGQQSRNNGIIFLIFPKDHQMRIEVGYGLEGALPDALAGQILNRIVTPHFQAGHFDEGVLEGVTAIQKAVRGEYQDLQTTSQLKPVDWTPFLLLILIVCAVVTVIDLFRFRKYARQNRTYEFRYGFGGWWFRFALLLFILNAIFRIVFYAMMASRGGYYGNRGGFGGFGGGGGGSFGGGGASGRW